jgi:acetyl-CoA carboxylase carboxyl transferase subunit beta|tara:strand:- start:1720 stop:2652 length:933 start_codon:yes stop_codon:yes gene_type:complete
MVNWLNKVIKAGERIKAAIRKRATKEELAKSNYIPCCKGLINKKEIISNYHTCPYCSKHFKVTPAERFRYLFDSGIYETFKTPHVAVDDPLNFEAAKRYIDQLKSARKKTGLNCSMVVASGEINKIKCTAVASDFMFMGASIEQNEGESVLFAAMHSIENKQPLIIVAQGGGMRMQASMLSLSQMPRTTVAINEVKAAGLPYIVIMTDPVAGGITASYAMLGDIHIAEPDATVAFAGRRVIQGTVREELPQGFQRSQAVLDAGFIDRICHRKDLNEEIGKLLSILLKKNSISTEELNDTSEDTQQISKTA